MAARSLSAARCQAEDCQLQAADWAVDLVAVAQLMAASEPMLAAAESVVVAKHLVAAYSAVVDSLDWEVQEEEDAAA